MNETLSGIIHGKMIFLESDPGLEDGRKVEVVLLSNKLPGPPPGWRPEGTATAAGMLAGEWTEADDRIFEEIQQDRKAARTSEVRP